jgi:hypothetical protein
MADVLTFLSALDTNAKQTALDIQAVASATAASGGGLAGGAGASGGMGAAGSSGPGSSTTAGGLDSALAWGKATVLTPAQVVSTLRLLQNRTNPLSGQMGSR